MAHYKGRSRRAPYKAKFIHDGKYEEVPMILQEKDGNGTYICMQVSDRMHVDLLLFLNLLGQRRFPIGILSREIGNWWTQDAHGCKIEDASGCLRMENLRNQKRKDLQVEFDSEGTLGCSDPVHPP